MKKKLLVIAAIIAVILCVIAVLLITCRHEHTPSAEVTIVKQPTCTTSGTAYTLCTSCGEVIDEVELPATGKHIGETISEIPATCTKTGLTAGEKCADCGAILTAQQEIPVLAHTYDDKYDANCNVCNHTRDAECRHDVETLKGVNPTCTAAGKTEGKKCKTCGEVLTAQTLIERLPHTYSKAVTAPTCTEKGYTTYTCACGDSYVSNYVNATGKHNYADGYCTHCGAEDPDPDRKAMREAEKAYADYKTKNGGTAPEYMLYEADGRFVALHNGTPKGVYENKEVALLALNLDISGKITDTGDGKLWAYHLPTWDTDGDGTLSILAIGNSFSVDALEYAHQIATSLGIEKVVIGNLYIGGCTLNMHIANASNDAASYTYYYSDTGEWSKTENYKISTALSSRSWDFVSLQQGSPVSGIAASYNEDLTNLISYVKERTNARLVWHMTWAYQQDTDHYAFPNYGKNQMTMYNAIVDAVKNRIQTNANFDYIVPNGTAVQNSRTSILGDTTTRDGYHMSFNYGRYLTGLLFVKTLTGLPIDDITYVPDGVTDLEKRIAIESVNNAHTKPFAVTKSNYSKESYMAIDLELFGYGYWNSNEQTNFNTIISNASNSRCYFATKQFTKEDLPLGSVILLKKGWQYRPEAWVDDRRQTSRNGTTTQSYVVITEEWWGSYMKRAFNISKVNAPALSGVDESEINAAFQIYIPIQ